MICIAKQPTSAPMLSFPHILWIKFSSSYYVWYRFEGRRNTKFTRISAIKHFLVDLCLDMSVIKVYNRKTILYIYLSFYLPSAPNDNPYNKEPFISFPISSSIAIDYNSIYCRLFLMLFSPLLNNNAVIPFEYKELIWRSLYTTTSENLQYNFYFNCIA